MTAWAPALNREILRLLQEQMMLEQERYEQAVERWRRHQPVDVTPLNRALARTETELLDLGRKNLIGFYDDQTYLALKAEKETEQRTLVKQIAELKPKEPEKRDLRTVVDAWGVALPLEQRHMIQLVLHHVRVFKRPDSPKYQPVWVDE